MPAQVKYERRRFTDGMNNATSLFGTLGGGGAITRGGGGGGGGQTRTSGGEQGFAGPVDAFAVDAADVDGTGIWIRPVSGGVLEAYPRTVNPFGGSTKLTTLTSGVTQAFYGKAADGTESLVIYGDAGASDKLMLMTLSGDNWLEGTDKHTFTANGARASMIAFNDEILVCNGTDSPISIDMSSGTVTDPIQVTRPTVTNATAVAQDQAGNVVGTVRYYLSQMTGSPATTESALSASFGGTAGNSEVDCGVYQEGQGCRVVIDLTHGDFGANTYRLYRSYANFVAPNFVAEITGGNTYTDNKADATLGGLPRLHGDPPPATITSWVAYRDRVWGLSGNDLYFSDPNEHTSWFTGTNGNVIKIHEDDGDTGTALARDRDGIIIFKENHIYKLLGDTPASFRLTDALATVDGHSIGTPHVNSVVAVPGGLIFWWRNGVYAYSGGQISKISAPVESQWVDPTSDYPEDDAVSLGYDPRFSHVYVAFNFANSGAPEAAFIFDLNSGLWIGATVEGAQKYLYDPGTATRPAGFYAFSSNGVTNVVKLVADAFDADGVAQEGGRFVPSGAFVGADANTLKRWLYMDMFFSNGVSTTTLTVTPNIDGTDLSGVSVALPTTPGRKRINIGELGYRLSYEVVWPADADDRPWGVFEVVAAYQEFPGANV